MSTMLSRIFKTFLPLLFLLLSLVIKQGITLYLTNPTISGHIQSPIFLSFFHKHYNKVVGHFIKQEEKVSVLYLTGDEGIGKKEFASKFALNINDSNLKYNYIGVINAQNKGMFIKSLQSILSDFGLATDIIQGRNSFELIEAVTKILQLENIRILLVLEDPYSKDLVKFFQNFATKIDSGKLDLLVTTKELMGSKNSIHIDKKIEEPFAYLLSILQENQINLSSEDLLFLENISSMLIQNPIALATIGKFFIIHPELIKDFYNSINYKKSLELDFVVEYILNTLSRQEQRFLAQIAHLSSTYIDKDLFALEYYNKATSEKIVQNLATIGLLKYNDKYIIQNKSIKDAVIKSTKSTYSPVETVDFIKKQYRNGNLDMSLWLKHLPKIINNDTAFNRHLSFYKQVAFNLEYQVYAYEINNILEAILVKFPTYNSIYHEDWLSIFYKYLNSSIETNVMLDKAMNIYEQFAKEAINYHYLLKNESLYPVIDGINHLMSIIYSLNKDMKRAIAFEINSNSTYDKNTTCWQKATLAQYYIILGNFAKAQTLLGEINDILRQNTHSFNAVDLSILQAYLDVHIKPITYIATKQYDKFIKNSKSFDKHIQTLKFSYESFKLTQTNLEQFINQADFILNAKVSTRKARLINAIEKHFNIFVQTSEKNSVFWSIAVVYLSSFQNKHELHVDKQQLANAMNVLEKAKLYVPLEKMLEPGLIKANRLIKFYELDLLVNPIKTSATDID